MSGTLYELPKVTDCIIKYLVDLGNQKGAQDRIENVVRARRLLTEARDIIYGAGIYDVEGCYGSEECEEGKCQKFQECKADHELYMKLIGGWKLTHEGDSQ